ncbi:hypothetical protein [Streptomyces sp. NPDC006879]|uniref:hypothetical protein n=1 Tax=Streptomyces sp. NPDC006879 TaxID=3364767 RepID=UPI0036BB29D1
MNDGRHHTAVPIMLSTTDRRAGITELRDDASGVTVTLTLATVAGTGLLLGGAFLATRHARSRRKPSRGH